jgi:DivIVA domain-containing protein
MWVFAILIVLALGGVALIAAGRSTPLADAPADRSGVPLPAGHPLGPDDLRTARFSVTLRGYRMSEVDALLERLATEAEARQRPAEQAPSEAPEPEA